jgi:hypothetical protein
VLFRSCATGGLLVVNLPHRVCDLARRRGRAVGGRARLACECRGETVLAGSLTGVACVTTADKSWIDRACAVWRSRLLEGSIMVVVATVCNHKQSISEECDRRLS